MVMTGILENLSDVKNGTNWKNVKGKGCARDKDYKLVLAFEATQDEEVIIIDRTETYSPNK